MQQGLFALVIAVLAFGLAYQFYPWTFGRSVAPVTAYSLEGTIRDIKSELLEVGSTPGETAGLQLTDIKVELTAQAEQQADGSASLAVPVFAEASLKASQSEKLTEGSKLTVVLRAPKGQELLSGLPEPQLDLSELVLATRRALLATLGEEPALTPVSVNIQVNFILIRSRADNSSIKAHVVEIGATSEQTQSGGNSVLLTYRNPAFVQDQGSATPTPP